MKRRVRQSSNGRRARLLDRLEWNFTFRIQLVCARWTPRRWQGGKEKGTRCTTPFLVSRQHDSTMYVYVKTIHEKRKKNKSLRRTTARARLRLRCVMSNGYSTELLSQGIGMALFHITPNEWIHLPKLSSLDALAGLISTRLDSTNPIWLCFSASWSISRPLPALVEAELTPLLSMPCNTAQPVADPTEM